MLRRAAVTRVRARMGGMVGGNHGGMGQVRALTPVTGLGTAVGSLSPSGWVIRSSKRRWLPRSG